MPAVTPAHRLSSPPGKVDGERACMRRREMFCAPSREVTFVGEMHRYVETEFGAAITLL